MEEGGAAGLAELVQCVPEPRRTPEGGGLQSIWLIPDID